MAKILIYTTSNCPYCVSAKRFLKAQGLPFEEIDLTDKVEELKALKERTGWQTVPQIFINDKLIGGYTDMMALESSGELKKLMSNF